MHPLWIKQTDFLWIRFPDLFLNSAASASSSVPPLPCRTATTTSSCIHFIVSDVNCMKTVVSDFHWLDVSRRTQESTISASYRALSHIRSCHSQCVGEASRSIPICSKISGLCYHRNIRVIRAVSCPLFQNAIQSSATLLKWSETDNSAACHSLLKMYRAIVCRHTFSEILDKFQDCDCTTGQGPRRRPEWSYTLGEKDLSIPFLL